MFIGHYGPSFVAKTSERRLPLWLLFIAVQWMDLWWSVLVLLGIEKVRIVPGFTAASPLDLYYMPYTHGLFGALAASAVLGGLVAWRCRERPLRVFGAIAAAVFSHWLLDLVVHVPDLPLWGNAAKVGFGLWRWPALSVPLELATLAAGAWIYARSLPATRGGRVWLWGFVMLLSIVELCNVVGPPPAGARPMAVMALVAYSVLAALAWLVERKVTADAAATEAPARNGRLWEPAAM